MLSVIRGPTVSFKMLLYRHREAGRHVLSLMSLKHGEQLAQRQLGS